MVRSVFLPPLFTGLAPEQATDNRTYTSILYGNGPGYQISSQGRPSVDAEESGKVALSGGLDQAGPLLHNSHLPENEWPALESKGPSPSEGTRRYDGSPCQSGVVASFTTKQLTLCPAFRHRLSSSCTPDSRGGPAHFLGHTDVPRHTA